MLCQGPAAVGACSNALTVQGSCRAGPADGGLYYLSVMPTCDEWEIYVVDVAGRLAALHGSTVVGGVWFYIILETDITSSAIMSSEGNLSIRFWSILKTADLPAPELVSLSTTAFFDSWARHGVARPLGVVKSWPAFADTGSSGYIHTI